ncbi:ABC transporter related [Methanosphaerula palustris E1-9c]|uniref:ABC transporter related n=1 Tax=Methanosphaerula palustris (strain ATCC BAA-1556 / DSM 19958 / E1-9c) TaxID=521011 RepID=B8GHI7_METPE|nr:ABC transporter related [Methanosphaerula palustris E1-9c]
MRESIIRIEHLSKVFPSKQGPVAAVDDISFEVKRGEIFGLLGPNGAGKSTLIRILTTLISPSSGAAFIDSYEVSASPEQIRGLIGVCPQNSTLDQELTAYDNLEFYGRLQNMEDRVLKPRIWQLLEMTGLQDRARSPVSTFSGGMKRKLEIVRAFIHKPDILFLDEPTIGLDPESRREVWQQIEQLNVEETTIILTTHYMDEAERLCNRIAFVDQGRLIALDTMENLRRSFPVGDLIEIGVVKITGDLLARIREIPQVGSVDVRGLNLLIVTRDASIVLPDLLRVLEQFSNPMTSIAIRSPSLEDIFIYLTGQVPESDAIATGEVGRQDS